MGFVAVAGDGPTTLQNAGSIAAIIGASVAVLLLVVGIVKWRWRRRRIRSVKPRIHTSGEQLYLEIRGLPASTDVVTALVSDGTTTKRYGPSAYRADISHEMQFNLRHGDPLLDETVKKWKLEIFTTTDRGERRRAFKGKLPMPRDLVAH